MPRRRYPTDLPEQQWALLEPLVPVVKPGGRPLKHPRRESMDAVRSVLRGGPEFLVAAGRVRALSDGISMLKAWTRDRPPPGEVCPYSNAIRSRGAVTGRT